MLGGVHKKIYELSTGPVVTYSGTYSLSDVTVGGVDYTLLTCTKSGTLYSEVSLRYWMCSGGGKGGDATGAGSGGGGGGLTKTGTIAAGQYTVTIGSGNGGTTKIGSTSIAGGSPGSGMDGGNGASGGGAAATTGYDMDAGTYYEEYGTPGTGKGTSTYPFGLTSLYAHSPGGGAGATKTFAGSYYGGGDGGSNGSAGKTNTTSNSRTGGTGGKRGGGKGGNVTSSAGSNGGNGSFYGAGGGGTGRINSSATLTSGSGYQGVAYFLIPKDAQFMAA